MALTVSVVIVTFRRPDDVARCLRAVKIQSRGPDQIVVVDASPDLRTRDVVASHPDVLYLRNEAGAGTTATSRAIAVEHVTCDIVAFLDDDSVPLPDWLEALVLPYEDMAVAAVGGRVINSDEEVAAADPRSIGQFLPSGQITGNFAADPGTAVRVAHLLGANMSYRMRAIADVGGIRDFYPGTCAREDSDLGLRMWRAGMPVIFNPSATVHHIAGTYAKGRRFDRRYQFYTHRNHLVLLHTIFGPRNPYLRTYAVSVLRDQVLALRGRAARATSWTGGIRGVAAGLTRAAADVAGLVAGLRAASRLSQSSPGDPPRRTGSQFQAPGISDEVPHSQVP